MINTGVLVSGVVGILLSALVAYLVIAPIVNNDEAGDTLSVITTDTNDALSARDAINGETKDSNGDVPEAAVSEVVHANDGAGAEKIADESAIDDATVAPRAAPVEITPTPVVQPDPALTKTGYTLAEVATHATKDSCWTVVNGNVYDLTSYIEKHPGGERNIMKICGTDGTELFTDQHGGQTKPESRLESLYIGVVRE